MRLTLSLDARGTLTVRAEHAAGYEPDTVARRITALVARELHRAQQTGVDDEPADEADRQYQMTGAAVSELAAPCPTPGPPGEETRSRALRRWALRLLDRGLTVEEVALRVPVAPELIARWDDDAASDAETDQLAEPEHWTHPGRAS
jgi:hypothetical protein